MSSCVPGRAAGAPCGKSRPCPPRSGCLQSRRRCFSPVPMQAHLRRVKGESPLLSRGGKTGAAPLHSHSLPYRGLSAQRPWFLPRRIHSSGGKTCRSAAAAAGRLPFSKSPVRRKGKHPGTGGGAPQGIACKPSYPGFRAKRRLQQGQPPFSPISMRLPDRRPIAARARLRIQAGASPCAATSSCSAEQAPRSGPGPIAGQGPEGRSAPGAAPAKAAGCPVPCRCARAWRAGGFPKRRNAFAAILRGAS